jgi:prepilin-type N-terminal cleavage/methylation domain-containing protein
VRDERGFTIIELFVTLGLMSIAMAIAFAFISQFTTASGRAITDVNAENNARLALRTITEDIRAARPATIAFTGASSTCPSSPTAGTCLSFTILRDTEAKPACQSVITYGLLSGSVKETRQDSGCVTNIAFAGKTVLSSVVNGSTALFAYYDKQGNLLTSGQSAAGSVSVTLMLQYQANSPILNLTSYASLRNAR